jgi:hypothetical protein
MSQTRGNYTEIDLPLSQVNSDLTRCPRCQGTYVTLEGEFLRHYREEFQDGQSVNIVLGERCKLAARIACPACQVVFQLIPDDVFNEKHDNMRIRIELAKRDGLLQELNEEKITIQ